ncbi:hypothetical protein Ddc_16289 [Ditylenchus destructor]|nr:hypothetical protein Ddc_16289 [Ditylenchus destructor]
MASLVYCFPVALITLILFTLPHHTKAMSLRGVALPLRNLTQPPKMAQWLLVSSKNNAEKNIVAERIQKDWDWAKALSLKGPGAYDQIADSSNDRRLNQVPYGNVVSQRSCSVNPLCFFNAIIALK